MTDSFSAQHLFSWLGRFHILVIHFPIALLFAAAFGELCDAVAGKRRLEPAVRFCVLVAAGSAVVAVVLGWLHADVGGYGAGSSRDLKLHRWLGTAAGLCALGTAALSESEPRHTGRRTLFRAALWSGTILVALTAHVGGILVHGDGFLDW